MSGEVLVIATRLDGAEVALGKRGAGHTERARGLYAVARNRPRMPRLDGARFDEQEQELLTSRAALHDEESFASDRQVITACREGLSILLHSPGTASAL